MTRALLLILALSLPLAVAPLARAQLAAPGLALDRSDLDDELVALLRERIYRRYLELSYAYRREGRWTEALDALRQSLRFGRGGEAEEQQGLRTGDRVLSERRDRPEQMDAQRACAPCDAPSDGARRAVVVRGARE